jgi:tetratricopeptide (TPR) repeat protein
MMEPVTRVRVPRVVLVVVVAAASAVVPAGGRQGRGAAPPLPYEVRVALAHGDVEAARRLVALAGASEARELSAALVEIFEGNEEAARQRLEPLARQRPLGEAAVEIGWIDLRRGRRDEAVRRLDPIASNRAFAGPDDYLLLSRAARGVREFLLANDAFVRIENQARADIHAEWGDLFLERHQPADAVTSYRRALELDARWIPALVGMARAMADDEPESAHQAFERALKEGSGHPDVWRLAAERRLDVEDLDGAEAALDRWAAIRPRSADEAALRAALAYAREDAPAVEAAIAAVRAANPRSALAFRRLGERAAHAYRFEEAAAFARRAVEADPDDAQAQFDLGLYLMRTGDEARARTALDRSWDLDKSSGLTKNLLDVLDVIATFETVTAGDFVFKFPKAEAEVLKAYAIPLADEATKVFGARYGFRPSGPILVEVFSKHDDFAVRTLGLPGLVGALGACFGRVISMDSPTARPPGDFSWQATLWHEIAHVYTLQLSKYRVPRWLTEGVSVYEEHRRRAAWGRELSLPFAQQLARGRTFGLKGLPGAFKVPESLALAYFEASLVVEHLVELNGDAGLRTLILAYADGLRDAEAFARAFGRSVEAVEASFKAFVDARYGALAKAMAAPPSEPPPDDLPALRARAAAAPGNFASQMALGVALVKAGDPAGARPTLERAAALAPSAMGAASPRPALARMAEDEGDLARARREWRALLEHDHTHVAGARRLAVLAERDPAAAGDLDFALRLVADLDPFDAETHSALGRRLVGKDPAAALIEFRAALAAGPANVAESRADLAEALLKLGRRDEAKREALLALQLAPTFARAQDLLLAAMGRL